MGYITLGFVILGTIITVIILVRDILKDKRRIKLEVVETLHPDSLSNPDDTRKSITIIVNNMTIHPLNISSIGLIDNKKSYHNIPLSRFGYSVAGQIPVKAKSKELIGMDFAFTKVLKGNQFTHAYIKDIENIIDKTKLPEHIKQIFI